MITDQYIITDQTTDSPDIPDQLDRLELFVEQQQESLKAQDNRLHEENEQLRDRLDRIETELGLDATADQRRATDD